MAQKTYKATGWATAKCGHIVEKKNSPCPSCDKKTYLAYWQVLKGGK